VTGAFRDRLRRSFAGHGLAAEERCIFLPHMPFERFRAVARLADIFLDSVGWSGCNSTLESLEWDLPVVTWPRLMMRSRHSAAFLAMMGVEETIADSAEAYVDIAVRLGLDPAWRRQVAHKIRSNKHKVMADEASIRGLEEFLRAVARPAPRCRGPA